MIILRSFAKINLGLEVTGKRKDGYHTLRTVFQTIDLSDDIELREVSEPRFRLTGDNPRVAWDERNLIARACRLVADTYRLAGGFDITVRKRIPPGSGLGGGSGNAAVMLLFLNQHFSLGIPLSRLIEMAASLGADVPFFLFGGMALGEGIGEKLTPLPGMPPRPVVLFMPALPVSTALAFSRFRLTKARAASKIDFFLKKGDFSVLENDLEKATFEIFPEIRKIKGKMMQGGCELVQMTGSGSAVFGMGPRGQLESLRALLPGSILTSTISRNQYQERIGVWPSGKASAFGAEIRRFESSRPRKTK